MEMFLGKHRHEVERGRKTGNRAGGIERAPKRGGNCPTAAGSTKIKFIFAKSSFGSGTPQVQQGGGDGLYRLLS